MWFVVSLTSHLLSSLTSITLELRRLRGKGVRLGRRARGRLD